MPSTIVVQYQVGVPGGVFAGLWSGHLGSLFATEGGEFLKIDGEEVGFLGVAGEEALAVVGGPAKRLVTAHTPGEGTRWYLRNLPAGLGS